MLTGLLGQQRQPRKARGMLPSEAKRAGPVKLPYPSQNEPRARATLINAIRSGPLDFLVGEEEVDRLRVAGLNERVQTHASVRSVCV
jgi:hypothetical protein